MLGCCDVARDVLRQFHGVVVQAVGQHAMTHRNTQALCATFVQRVLDRVLQDCRRVLAWLLGSLDPNERTDTALPNLLSPPVHERDCK